MRRLAIAVILAATSIGCKSRSKLDPLPGPPAAAPVDAMDHVQAAREVALAMSGHMIVLKSGPMPEYADVIATARQQPGIVFADAFAFTHVSMSALDRPNLHEVALKGVDPKGATAEAMSEYLTAGNLKSLEGDTIVLGAGLAKALGITVGGEVEARSKRGNTVRLRVAGTFHVVVEAYDRELGIVALATLQKLLGDGDRAHGIEIRVRTLDQAPAIARQLEKALGGAPYLVHDYLQLNADLFR